jgi:hypothetical protein
MELAILGLAPVSGADTANFRRLLGLLKLAQRVRNGGDISRALLDNPRLRLLFRMVDRDRDGTLDASERRCFAILLERIAAVMGSSYWPFLRMGAVLSGLTVLGMIVFLTLRRLRKRPT